MHATGVVFVGHGRALLAVLLLTLTLAFGITGSATAEPAGDVIIAWHVTLASSWLDPATAPPQITPFAVLYALHDALIRPLPGQRIGASLAESWKESPDGLVYEFKIRKGVKFHNGDPVTSEDVKFSYSKGSYAYGGYPDLDDLFQQQARERDVKRREALLHQIQQLTVDRAMFIPIMDYRTLRGVGPRIAEHALDTLHLVPSPAHEEIKLK